jgi:hypothetical protein
VFAHTDGIVHQFQGHATFHVGEVDPKLCAPPRRKGEGKRRGKRRRS